MNKAVKAILSIAFMLSSVASLATVDYCMPTPSRKVTSPYGERWGRLHKGLDVKVQIGDTIRSAFDGEVVRSTYNDGGYGFYIIVRHKDGFETLYAHLSRLLVRVGDKVEVGMPIGLGGNSGRSTGPHLHFEVRIDGKAIDPKFMFDFEHQSLLADNLLQLKEKKHLAANEKVSKKSVKKIQKANVKLKKDRQDSHKHSDAKKSQPNSLCMPVFDVPVRIVCQNSSTEDSQTIIIPLGNSARPTNLFGALSINTSHNPTSDVLNLSMVVEIIQPPPQPPQLHSG